METHTMMPYKPGTSVKTGRMQRRFTLIEHSKPVRNLRRRSGRAGFTLIELLVVISIIVVLLALLTPALDKAVVEAKMTVCGAQAKGLGTGTIAYAMENKRNYLYRADFEAGGEDLWDWTEFNKVATPDFDSRENFKDMLGSLDMLVCPLVDMGMDIEGADTGTHIYVGYNMFFGARVRATDTSTSMMRMGQKFRMSDQDHAFDALAGTKLHFAGEWGWSESSHPLRSGAGEQWFRQDSDLTANGAFGNDLSVGYQWWGTQQEWLFDLEHSEIDLTFVLQDGSVHRYNNVIWDEYQPGQLNERLSWVYHWNNQREPGNIEVAPID